MPTRFQFVPPSGSLSGASFESQVEQAFDDLGEEIDNSNALAQQAVDTVTDVIATANDALNDALNVAQSANDNSNYAVTLANQAQISADAAQQSVNNAQITANNAITAVADIQTVVNQTVADVTFAVDSASSSVVAKVELENGDISDRAIPLALGAVFIPNPLYKGVYSTTLDIKAIVSPVKGNFADNKETNTEWLYSSGIWVNTGFPFGTTSHGDETPGYSGLMPHESLEQIDNLTDQLAYKLNIADYNANNVYSTSEVNTGKKWIDGKIIYRKLFETGALPNTSTKTIAHNIENIDKVVQLYGTAYNASSTTPIPYPSTTVAATIMLTCSKTSINIITGGNLTTFTNSTIILHYTKTS